MRKTYTEHQCDQIEQLIGFTITSPMEDPSKEYFGFQCKKGKKVKNVWVNMDPEGNGPGHLNIEDQE